MNNITITKEPSYCTDYVSIKKTYLELKRIITFSIWDDMSFNAYTRELCDEIAFDFNISDSIYFCLLNLLKEDEKLIIDDDDTYEEMMKYIKFERLENKIKITFFNHLKESPIHNKFSVFVKNICPDSRSKIRNFETKKRLVDFFRECEKTLLEDYRQITFDEYLEYEKQLIKTNNFYKG